MPVDLSGLVPPTRWECPHCNLRDATREAGVHTRFHACSGKDGLTMPMVREGDRVKVTLTERGDYLGTEDVPLVDGTPYMNVTTEHADGHTDVAVFAPTAYSDGR